MDTLLALLTSTIATVLGALFSLIFARLSRKRRQQIDQRRKEAEEQLLNVRNYLGHRWSADLNVAPYRQELIKQWLSNIANSSIQRSPQISKEEIKSEIEAKTKELAERLEKIEKRMPSEATLDKVASVNDAILATNLEALSETIRRIEERLITKWDVAKIVFAIIGSLGALTGLVITIIKFMSKATG